MQRWSILACGDGSHVRSNVRSHFCSPRRLRMFSMGKGPLQEGAVGGGDEEDASRHRRDVIAASQFFEALEHFVMLMTMLMLSLPLFLCLSRCARSATILIRPHSSFRPSTPSLRPTSTVSHRVPVSVPRGPLPPPFLFFFLSPPPDYFNPSQRRPGSIRCWCQ